MAVTKGKTKSAAAFVPWVRQNIPVPVQRLRAGAVLVADTGTQLQSAIKYS